MRKCAGCDNAKPARYEQFPHQGTLSIVAGDVAADEMQLIAPPGAAGTSLPEGGHDLVIPGGMVYEPAVFAVAVPLKAQAIVAVALSLTIARNCLVGDAASIWVEAFVTVAAVTLWSAAFAANVTHTPPSAPTSAIHRFCMCD